MKRVRNLIVISAFSLLVLGLPAIASAQYGQYDPYGRNGGYNNGQYGSYGNNSDPRSAIRDLKHRAGDFQRQLDRDLDHSRINGSIREDQMNGLARQFKDAVNHLNNNGYYDNGSYGNNRGYNEMSRVFDLASQIDRSISRSGVSYSSRNIWSGVRSDLQALGYNGGRYNGGYGNGRVNNNGSYNRPSWWPF